MKFHKYHGLGNDYIVIDPAETKVPLDEKRIKLICHRNYGVGSDGILFGPEICGNGFNLRIYNPDGSEAEKSGNGLRIFSRYLWDKGLVNSNVFTIHTRGGAVKAQVVGNGNQVQIEMGRVSFDASIVPVLGESGEVLNREMEVCGKVFKYSAATIGNPHCVITSEQVSPETARKYGPLIEIDKRFPNRTNVQFMKRIDDSSIQIEIWERGAGYTLASGSSSIAASAVAYKLGLCGNKVSVRMPGGELSIAFSDDFDATMVGPVTAVCDGEIREELLN